MEQFIQVTAATLLVYLLVRLTILEYKFTKLVSITKELNAVSGTAFNVLASEITKLLEKSASQDK